MSFFGDLVREDKVYIKFPVGNEKTNRTTYKVLAQDELGAPIYELETKAYVEWGNSLETNMRGQKVMTKAFIDMSPELQVKEGDLISRIVMANGYEYTQEYPVLAIYLGKTLGADQKEFYI